MAKNTERFGPVEKVTPDKIIIPINIIEALLVAIDMGDRNAINNVGQEIRELAQTQSPEKFPA